MQYKANVSPREKSIKNLALGFHLSLFWTALMLQQLWPQAWRLASRMSSHLPLCYEHNIYWRHSQELIWVWHKCSPSTQGWTVCILRDQKSKSPSTYIQRVFLNANTWKTYVVLLFYFSIKLVVLSWNSKSFLEKSTVAPAFLFLSKMRLQGRITVKWIKKMDVV